MVHMGYRLQRVVSAFVPTIGASLTLACVLPTATASAQSTVQASAQGVGRVGGVIFDSLSGRPLRGATVFISGSNKLGLSNDLGQFTIDSVMAGRQSVSFSTPLLDSLGLSGMINRVQVVAGAMSTMHLATPSFGTLWRSLCPRTLVSRVDSGIVFGSVRNAATEAPLRGARAVFSWTAMEANGKALAMNRPVLVARTDSLGNFAACGLPTDISFTMEADAGTLISGGVDFTLFESRLAHRDILVSAELTPIVATPARPNSRMSAPVLAAPKTLRGTSTLTGTVRDSRGVPQANTLVTVPSADTSGRTDAEGRYQIERLPAGTQSIRVRKLGFGPTEMQVDLRPGQTSQIDVELPAATVLARVDVKAARSGGVARQEFDERKKIGGGHFLTERELESRPDMTSVLSALPAVKVRRNNMTTSVTVDRGATSCVPAVFLDGRPSSVDEMTFVQPADLFGVEVYTHAADIPARFIGINQCGVIAIWTKLAK